MKGIIGKLRLDDMEFYAYHGVLEEERKIGAVYYVSLSLELDISAAVESDNLEHTIDYSKVYEQTKAQMQVPSKLIEHVAGRIAKVLLDNFGELLSVEICLTKTKPPVNANLSKSSITLKLYKNEG